MDDDTLVQGFESCTLPSTAFGHREHVRVAWLYLRSAARFEEGAARFCGNLRRFADAHGRNQLYNETITWAYLDLVNERLHTSEARDFDSFASENADLFETNMGALLAFYDPQTLHSELARRAFLLPRVTSL